MKIEDKNFAQLYDKNKKISLEKLFENIQHIIAHIGLSPALQKDVELIIASIVRDLGAPNHPEIFCGSIIVMMMKESFALQGASLQKILGKAVRATKPKLGALMKRYCESLSKTRNYPDIFAIVNT